MPAAAAGLMFLGGCGSGEPPEVRRPTAREAALEPEGSLACNPGAAADHRDQSEIEIRFGDLSGYQYDPDCFRVRRGTSLRFLGDLAAHPLEAGTVEGLEVRVEPGNPIPSADSGTEVAVVMNAVGSFGFYCGTHVHEAMTGRVFVE